MLAGELDCPYPVLFEDGEAAMHILWIAQKAVANVVKHTGATRIHLQCEEDKKTAFVAYPRRGVRNARERSMGLDIMRYRGSAIGAVRSSGAER